MKKIMKALALAALILAAPATQAQNPLETGIGPAISGSEQVTNLPHKAQKFIGKHFKGAAIAQVRKDFTDGEYEVTLSDGTQVEFTAKGDFKDAEARENGLLSTTTVKSILPRKTYNTLEKKNLARSVDGIKYVNKRYQVEVKHPSIDEIVIHEDGNILTVEYDD